MKTPREVILGRHQSAAPKLEVIRAEVLAAYARIGTAQPPHRFRLWNSLASLARSFWQESLWPWRKTWFGLAGAWIVLLAFHFGSAETPRAAIKQASRPDASVRMALREQKQLMSQLLESAVP